MRPRPPLEAVTLDANGTLLRLVDPVAGLRAALAEHGVERDAATVRNALAAEVSHYLPRAHGGRDGDSLAALRRDAVAVFLRAAGAELEADAFVRPFLSALRFEPEPRAVAALDALRARGLRLACVANWDMSLPETLARAGLANRFDAIVSSADAGVPKPDPAAFDLALARLGVEARAALHCGDEPADEEGAAAAGLRFAPPPVSTLPARLAREAK